jgi:hypothetical protein
LYRYAKETTKEQLMRLCLREGIGSTQYGGAVEGTQHYRARITLECLETGVFRSPRDHIFG